MPSPKTLNQLRAMSAEAWQQWYRCTNTTPRSGPHLPLTAIQEAVWNRAKWLDFALEVAKLRDIEEVYAEYPRCAPYAHFAEAVDRQRFMASRAKCPWAHPLHGPSNG